MPRVLAELPHLLCYHLLYKKKQDQKTLQPSCLSALCINSNFVCKEEQVRKTSSCVLAQHMSAFVSFIAGRCIFVQPEKETCLNAKPALGGDCILAAGCDEAQPGGLGFKAYQIQPLQIPATTGFAEVNHLRPSP